MHAKPRNDDWKSKFHLMMDVTQKSTAEVAIYGDSIAMHFGDKAHYAVWKKEVDKEVVIYGMGGDRIENLLWRIIHGKVPKLVNVIVVHIGTNNIVRDEVELVAHGIINICQKLHERKRHASIFLTGLLPGAERPLHKVVAVNNLLHTMTILNSFNTYFVPPSVKEWINSNGDVNPIFYQKDKLHLNVEGYKLLIYHIQKISTKSCNSLLLPFSLKPVETCPSNDAIWKIERIS